jgi:hypothetical protein
MRIGSWLSRKDVTKYERGRCTDVPLASTFDTFILAFSFPFFEQSRSEVSSQRLRKLTGSPSGRRRRQEMLLETSYFVVGILKTVIGESLWEQKH